MTERQKTQGAPADMSLGGRCPRCGPWYVPGRPACGGDHAGGCSVPDFTGVCELLDSQQDAATIDSLAHEISDLLNASYSPGADPELILWRRLTKVSEEAGEVQDALRGWVGENPRKGVTHTRSDVITELLDCAGAALGSVAHLLTGDEPAITDLLRERLEFVAGRLRPATPVEPARQWAVRAEDGTIAFSSEDVARRASVESGWTLNSIPITSGLTRTGAKAEWQQLDSIGGSDSC